jgi:hypothetical protein
MLVRVSGIRDIRAVTGISITKILSILTSFKGKVEPPPRHYDRLEVDEFWTYMGKKARNTIFVSCTLKWRGGGDDTMLERRMV